MTPAENIVENVCKIKKDERVLIIANPETNDIAQDLYLACNKVNAKPVLIFQNSKTSFENAEIEVIEAIKTNPDVCFSVSAVKLGKDKEATANPYKDENGETYNHIFDYLLSGKKSMRAVWTPGITTDMFNRTVNIDYCELANRCSKLGECFENVQSIHVKAEGGTDVFIPVKGRKLLNDDGDFSKTGSGGNIPAGEVFISPVVGCGNGSDKVPEENYACADGTSGVIVFDGSMTFSDGDSILETPIKCVVEKGFVVDISGGQEAARLKKTVSEAEKRALELEKQGKLPEGMGKIYKRNARNIGELGIGLNPAARITGNMLEDEKAFTTCHFAIGENYDNDAPSLIHLDGVVRNPTIVLYYEDGSAKKIMEKGQLLV